MADIINTLQQPDNVKILLSVLLVLIAFSSLILFFKRREVQMQDRMDEYKEKLKLAQKEEREAEAELREEEPAAELPTEELRELSDNMMRTLGEVGRTLQGQMDTFHTQVSTLSLKEEQRMDAMQRMVDERMMSYEERIGQVTKTLDEKLLDIRNRSEEQLESLKDTVDENLHKTLGESFQTMNERLEQVYQGLGEMQGLAAGIVDLRKVLTNVKVLGVWGETQLGALLEQMLAPSQYMKNALLSGDSEERVQFAVCMPGSRDKTVYLPIKAFFPQAEYDALIDAVENGENADVETAAAQLEHAILQEAQYLHAAYIQPPHTTDFALMFLPMEGLYAEVLRRQGLQERLQSEYRIVIAGPTTLSALLNSLQMGFRSLAIEQRTSEVWQILGQVKVEFEEFTGSVDDAQMKLQRAVNALEEIRRRTQLVNKKLTSAESAALEDGTIEEFLLGSKQDA